MNPKSAVLGLFCLLIPVAAGAGERPALKPFKVAVLCFSTGEQTSGMNKICYYDCMGSTVAINVRNIDICPLSINR